MIKDVLTEDVINAWRIPGRNHKYHHEMQDKLRKKWPVLAKALDRLVQAQILR